jgi:hypothetical protein
MPQQRNIDVQVDGEMLLNSGRHVGKSFKCVTTVLMHAIGSPKAPSMPYAMSVAKSCSVFISYGVTPGCSSSYPLSELSIRNVSVWIIGTLLFPHC